MQPALHISAGTGIRQGHQFSFPHGKGRCLRIGHYIPAFIFYPRALSLHRGDFSSRGDFNLLRRFAACTQCKYRHTGQANNLFHSFPLTR